jgi:hypothetical protein
MESPRVHEVKCDKIQRAEEPGYWAEREKFKPIRKFDEKSNIVQVFVREYLHAWPNTMQLKIWISYGRSEILVMH